MLWRFDKEFAGTQCVDVLPIDCGFCQIFVPKNYSRNFFSEWIALAAELFLPSQNFSCRA
jgi:hypothetical protein